jgi:hypothetical protein
METKQRKEWWVQYDTGTYQKGQPPEAEKVIVTDGKLEEIHLPSSTVSASISLPLYSKVPQEEAVGNSYGARAAAMSLIGQIKKQLKFEGDVDIRVDSWVDKPTGQVRSALKYVAYAKKKVG